MTYLRPDNRKGLGLDVPGPEEPSYFGGSTTAGPRRWWLAGRNLASSIVRFVVWGGITAVYLVELIHKPHAVSGDWLPVVAVGMLALSAVPSIVYFLMPGRFASVVDPAQTADDAD